LSEGAIHAHEGSGVVPVLRALAIEPLVALATGVLNSIGIGVSNILGRHNPVHDVAILVEVEVVGSIIIEAIGNIAHDIVLSSQLGLEVVGVLIGLAAGNNGG